MKVWEKETFLNAGWKKLEHKLNWGWETLTLKLTFLRIGQSKLTM